MSTPEWTPEFKARCIAAAHAARSEPERFPPHAFEAMPGSADHCRHCDVPFRVHATEAQVIAELRASLATAEAARVAAVAERDEAHAAERQAVALISEQLRAAEERARALGAVVTAVRAHHAAMSRLDDHVERMDCYDTECRHASHEEESEAKAAVDVLLRAYPAPAATAKAPA